MSEVPTRLAVIGLNADDWARIRVSIEAVTEGFAPPALRDLSAPVAVAAVRYDPRYSMTDALGIVTRPDGVKIKLIWWPLSEHEQGFWREALERKRPQR